MVIIPPRGSGQTTCFALSSLLCILYILEQPSCGSLLTLFCFCPKDIIASGLPIFCVGRILGVHCDSGWVCSLGVAEPQAIINMHIKSLKDSGFIFCSDSWFLFLAISYILVISRHIVLHLKTEVLKLPS